MAERRMFAKAVVLSDAFLDMPASTRAFYFALGMYADDDGMIGNPKSIMRICQCTQEDLDILLEKRYLLTWPSGVVCIKHWRMNNYLKNDRHKETTYVEELSTLGLDAKGAYTEKTSPSCIQVVSKVETDGIQDGDTGKDSKDKYKKNSVSRNKKIHNFNERDYDFDELEAETIGRQKKM